MSHLRLSRTLLGSEGGGTVESPMELHAYTRTISDLLSVKKKYVVPRFQREYSWTKEQVTELWEDTVSSITRHKNGDFQHEEYFIGALVLVGSDKSPELQIVDGQQRLTTLTMLLSALCERFRQLGRSNLAEAIYSNYIAGKDDNGNEYFKLQNESPKPFFQKNIQHLEKSNDSPKTQEEKTLFAAYTDLLAFTDRARLAESINDSSLSDDQYEAFLKAIRDQVVSHLKVIFITVAEEDEAYTIFETLNARGMNLSFVDLIKNRLFKELNDEHPDDEARTTWNNIRSVITSREGVGSLEVFVRHWWISKYSYVSAEKVYKSFKTLWNEEKIDAKNFITQLHEDAHLYVKTSSPVTHDFRNVIEKDIFYSLSAFRIFGVTQQRPFVLSLFSAYERGTVKQNMVAEILLFLEKFHFMFNAVCSLRPSGVEASYSRAARGLRDAKNKSETAKVLDTLRESLLKRVPDRATFMEKFRRLRYSNSYLKDKRLIQYLLNTMVRAGLKTKELVPNDLTIEHVLSQSTPDKDLVGQIGNLLPLGKALNEDAADNSVENKLPYYLESDFPMTSGFARDFTGSWGQAEIEKRTNDIAAQCYDVVWKIA
jgi:uncharacterized protein with ParB-like and HNH nuclease domain